MFEAGKKPLGEVSEISLGWSLSRKGRSDLREARVIAVKDLGPAGVVAPSEELTAEQVPEEATRSTARVGDVLLVARGTQLRAALVSEESQGAVVTSNLVRLRLGPELRPEVLVAFFQSKMGQAELLARSQGTSSLLALPLSQVAAIPVPLPDAET